MQCLMEGVLLNHYADQVHLSKATMPQQLYANHTFFTDLLLFGISVIMIVFGSLSGLFILESKCRTFSKALSGSMFSHLSAHNSPIRKPV